MDVVYVLGSGSRWSNHEILYSLRSLEKHLGGFRNVYVVGDKPGFLKDIIHLPAGDMHGAEWKESNIYRKILKACNTPSVSDDFIFFNDDHFLLETLEPLSFPFYSTGTIKDKLARVSKGNPYRKTVHNTITVLEKMKLPADHYDLHCPAVINKAKFIKNLNQFNWKTEFGFLVKSLYCNTSGVKPVHISDCKIDGPHTTEELQTKIKDRPFFSIGDRGITPVLKKFMLDLYPHKSRFEK